MPNSAQKILDESITLFQNKQYSEAESKSARLIQDKAATKQQKSKAYYLCALCEYKKNQFDQSIALFKKALETDPNNHEVSNILGWQYASWGDSKKAEEYFRKALSVKENYASAWSGLVSCKKYHDLSDPDFESLQQLLETAKKAKNLSLQSSFHFSLGKLYDDVKNYSGAIEHYFEANYHKGSRFDPGSFEIFIKKVVKQFNKAYINKFDGVAVNPNFKPLFIVGMLRSGTTLLEQILSCHSQVSGVGEVSDITSIIQELPHALKVDNEWGAYKALKKDTLNEFAKSYKTRLMSLIKEETSFLVNKMPSNYLYLGLIKMLFPNAKIIHTQRHPGDTCTSCFFQNFINGNEYSFDAVHLGYYYREYLKLMDHWRYTLGGGFIFDLKYEALVSNPEKEIRKLLKFCGLDWEEACLKPEKLKRYVATASLAQVRKPINTSSIGRWENYSPWLKSLMRIDDLIKDYENSIV